MSAYRNTPVTVDRSRADIVKMLVTTWHARGCQWEDDFDTGRTVLRFRWKDPEGDGEVVVRLTLAPDPARVRGRAAERDTLRARESKRLHRVAFWWLKAMAEAVDAGLLKREEVLLPWVETPRGATLAELLAPRIGEVSSGRLALGPAKGAS